MSTRANIVIKDDYSKLFFYRHSDGYPEGTMPTINIFMDWLNKGKIRNNVGQAAGWLVLLGAMEYGTIPNYPPNNAEYGSDVDVSKIEPPSDWKAGAYEPTSGIHGDIDYLYIIDLKTKSIKCFEDWTDNGEGKGRPVNLTKQVSK